MMSEAVIVSIITGGLAFAGTVISNLSTHSKTMYRIEQLEKKQDLHNSVIERTYELEKAVSILDEREKALLERVEEISHEQ